MVQPTATILAKAILDGANSSSDLDSLRDLKDGVHKGVDKVVSYLSKKKEKEKRLGVRRLTKWLQYPLTMIKN